MTLALPSRAVHIFNFLTGKLTRTYDESLTAVMEMQQAGTAVFKLDDMDFGRRLAAERELDRGESGPGGLLRTANAVWDESGNFVLYPTMLGIKGNWPNMIQSIFQADIYLVVNAVTNKVARVLGKDETLRFLNIALYQGAPAKKGVTTIQMAASANPLLQDKASRDPHLFATAYQKQRFYLFARSDKECVSFVINICLACVDMAMMQGEQRRARRVQRETYKRGTDCGGSRGREETSFSQTLHDPYYQG